MYPEQQEEHMYPSPRNWERMLYEARGNIDDHQLEYIFNQQK